MDTRYISTSVLAKRIGKEPKEVFALLADSGWMHKIEQHWQLTEKGKFEGGRYLEHPKFGNYIAWPETVIAHPLLNLLPAAPLSAADLGHKWQLPARLVNAILRDAGLLEAYVHGWHVTAHGKSCGGEQHEMPQSGIPYATWPETLVDNPWLNASVQALVGDSGDLRVLDGHTAPSALAARLDNWLYINRIAHAAGAAIWVGEHWQTVDFYLPALRLALIVWPEQMPEAASSASPASQLQTRLAQREFFIQHQQAFIEVEDLPIDKLDEVLTKQLLQRGMAVY